MENLKPKHFNIFWKEVILFIVIQGLGLIVGLRVFRILGEQEIIPQPFSFLTFLAYFLFFTILILITLRFSKKERRGAFLKLLFILAILLGIDTTFGVFIGEPGAIILAGLLIILRFTRPTVLFHNLVVMLGMAGVGAWLGAGIVPRDAVIILFVLSLYDIVAVYKTKHMIKMARAMIKKRVILGLIIPENILGFKASMREVEKDKIPEDRKEKIEPAKFMILGGGDLILPMILIVSVAREVFLGGVVVLCFSVLGLIAMHLIFIKLKSRPMPALPPLALFCLIGYLITLLV